MLAISGDTFNPVQWSPPATRLNVSILLALICLAVLGFLVRQPKPDREATWAGSMALAIVAFAMMIIGYAVVPHEWITFADSILQWDDDHFVWHHGDAGGILFFDFTKRSLRDIVVVAIYGFMLVSNIGIMVQWQQRTKAQPPAQGEVVEPRARPAGISRFGRPLSRKA
jgi:hypothetical protein